jgi:flagellar biosynthetic protein FliR
VSLVFEELTVFLLVFVRMSGMLLTNPLFRRSNVPVMFRMALILALSILIAPVVDGFHISGYSDVDYIFSVFMELMCGVALGFVFQLFYQMLLFAGDFIDYMIGLMMSKVFDPGSNIQMSISGSVLSILFVLYLFATNGHIEIIRICASSYHIIPLGALSFNLNIGIFFVELISGLFMLTVKVVLPFLVAQVTLEAAMGILMKLIPQIHVFVINIQFRLVLGLALLFIFAVPVSRFLDNYLAILFDSMRNVLRAAAA